MISMKNEKNTIIANLGKTQKSPKNGGGLRLFVKWLYQMNYKDKKMKKQKKIFFFRKKLAGMRNPCYNSCNDAELDGVLSESLT